MAGFLDKAFPTNSLISEKTQVQIHIAFDAVDPSLPRILPDIKFIREKRDLIVLREPLVIFLKFAQVELLGKPLEFV